jgi:hypothetical protein
MQLLTRIAVAVTEQRFRDAVGRESNEPSKAIAALFPIHLSGTHASPEQRASVIRSLLNSTNPTERELGLKALASALEALHFDALSDFQFGSRSRDSGYWPADRESVVGWFGLFLRIAESFACSDHPEALRVREIVAQKFRGLWTSARMYDDLERLCRSFTKGAFWVDGWIAVRQITYYDSKGFTPQVSNRLASLEALLQPQGIVQWVRSIVLAGSASYVGVPLVGNADESVESAWPRLQSVAYDLGRSAAIESGAFGELLPELVRTRGDQAWSFGRGLAQGAMDPATTWKQLVCQVKLVPEEAASPVVFGGFLSRLYQANRALASSLLDEAIEDDVLGVWYPVLETATGKIDSIGLQRLIRSLTLGKAPIHRYRALQGGGATHDLSGSEFNQLLLRISDHPEGVDIAMEILVMRLSFERERSSSEELVEIGCELMRRLNVIRAPNSNSEYHLQIIGGHCLLGDKGASTVREVCTKLRDAVSRRDCSAYAHRELLQILFTAAPLAVMRSLCSGDAAMVKVGIRVLESASLLRPHAFDAIPEEELLSWCDELPDVRCPIAATCIVAIKHDEDGPQWTDIARKILKKSPDRVEVLKKFIRQFSLPGWDASRAAEGVQSNLSLLDDMVAYSDPALDEFAGKEKNRLSQVIAAAKEIMPPISMDRDEGFE